MAVRARLQEVVEMASLPNVTEVEQRAMLHIAVVGGGPTGVEISSEMTDLIKNDFSVLYPGLKGMFSITIHDVAPQVLSAFDQKLVEHALNSFRQSSVEVKTGSHITKVESDALYTAEDGRIPFGMLIWATGNKQVPLVDELKVSKSARLPRILTDKFLRPLDVDGNPIPNAFAIGDAADVQGGELPTTAEVACQKGSYVAKVLNSGLEAPFEYRQRALVAYTGQHDGVVAGRHDWSGRGAWLAWRSKNLSWSRSWRNKILITMNWSRK
jgi:NADH:ubiquinone reductase (non-electrogenic)